MPDLALWGYVKTSSEGLATGVSPGPFDLSAIGSGTGQRHALVHVSGFTCGACKAAALEMAASHPGYASRVLFVDRLAEGARSGDAATPTELEAWVLDRGIPFTTAIDLPGVGPRILKDFSPIENTCLVELEGLNVLAQSVEPSALYPALDEL